MNLVTNGVKRFILALQFLTIIPIGTKTTIEQDQLPQSTVYFPAVGLLLGLTLAGVNKFLSFMQLGQLLTSVILVNLLVILTGGLHLDGLADTFDALSSRKNKFEMLEIMRDSHIGTMGVLSLINVILIKVALLSSLDSELMNISLILMCLLGRYSLVFSMFLFPYARQEGKAKVFIEGTGLGVFSLATVVSLSCSAIIFGLKGIIIFVTTAILVYLIGRLIINKIGGITGDTLGATDELAEVFILLNIFILSGLWI